MGRVEQRLYRQQMARRRLGRMIVLTLLIFAAGALTLSRNAASHLTAETIAQPTATPIAAAYDQTVVSREITLAAETWYAIQTGVFSNEDAAREKAELLTDRGAPGAVVEDGEKWRVFIACYGTETDAASVRRGWAKISVSKRTSTAGHARNCSFGSKAWQVRWMLPRRGSRCCCKPRGRCGTPRPCWMRAN